MSTDAQSTLDERLKRAIQHVQENTERTTRLEDMAQAACMSPHHFSRTFKKAMGISPVKFAAKNRMEKARHLLRAGTLSIAAVAFVCGFSTQAHFTTKFKSFYGKTPARYQQAITKTKST